MSKRILVVGSANVDYVVGVDEYPAPGETRRGSDLEIWLGGKGANQAVAAARLVRSASVSFSAQVGDDDGGRAIRSALERDGIDLRSLAQQSDSSTGAAIIIRLPNGMNSIIIAPGANDCWSPESIARLQESVQAADVILLQLEIPLEVVRTVSAWAKDDGKMVILDPAPATSLSAEFFSSISLITPNETEACILLDKPVATLSDAELPQIAEQLNARVKVPVLLKAGARGSFYTDGSRSVSCPSYAAGHVVDTTAAGDTFNGALAVGLAEGISVDQAMRFAACAAGIAVTRRGAQNSIPRRAEVDHCMCLMTNAF